MKMSKGSTDEYNVMNIADSISYFEEFSDRWNERAIRKLYDQTEVKGS